jgi:hypothetical protein
MLISKMLTPEMLTPETLWHQKSADTRKGLAPEND